MNLPDPSTESKPENPEAIAKPRRSLLRGLAFGGFTLAVAAGAIIAGRQTLPFGIAMPSFAESQETQPIDPRAEVSVEGIGLGTRLVKAELRDETGKVLSEVTNQPAFEPGIKLEYGKKYTLSASAERLWLGQKEAREVTFTTVSVPNVESPLRQDLSANGTVSLKFSEPVGKITPSSELQLEVKPSASQQSFTLEAVPGGMTQGKTYTVDINWESPTGVPFPPFKLEVSTAPPLTASVASNGMSNLGIAMPVQIDFSEPLSDRQTVTQHITISSGDGQPIEGKWLWFGKQRVQFRPQPVWPAQSTIHVSIDPGDLKSARGGFLANPVNATFSTGADRRIEVFLDKQRVNVIENGEVIKTLKASTGKSKTPTVTGSFYIYARFPTKTMKSTGLKPGQKGYYEVKDVPYAQYFYEGYAFHGAFWHNNFGHPASHGCINLATRKKNGRKGVNEDAGWLYHWASLGVPVTVHRSSAQQDQVATTQ